MNVEKNFILRSILLVCSLIVIIFILCYCNLGDQGSTKDDQESTNFQINLKYSNMNEKLEKYIKTDYEVSIGGVNGTYIYGDIYDTTKNGDLFETENIFIYDTLNDSIEVFDFNYNYRILNYYFFDNYIYTSIIILDEDEVGYEWSVIKFDKNFTNAEVLKKGKILEPLSAPVFVYSDLSKELFIVAIDEQIKVDDGVIEKRIQNLNFYKIDDGKMVLVKDYKGNYIEKEGVMLCSVFDIQIVEDELLFCTTDYKTNQQIRAINISNLDELVLYSIDLNDNWIITSFQKNNTGLYIGYINMVDSQKGKTSYYNFSNNEINEIDSDVLYGRNSFMYQYILFHNLEKWFVYDTLKNKFYKMNIFGEYSDEYLYPTFYVLNSNQILVKGSNNLFYIGDLIF